MAETQSPFDPSYLDANLGRNADPDAPPKRWADLLTGEAAKIRRIRLMWRRGSAKYSELPSGAGRWAIPELTADPNGEDADERRNDPEAWGKHWARKAWRVAIDFTATNGPTLDFQLHAERWDEKKSEFVSLGAKAKRCSIDGDGDADGSSIANSDDRSVLAWVIGRQQAQIDQLFRRCDRRDEQIDKIFGSVGAVMARAVDLANAGIDMKAKAAEGVRAENKDHRDFLARVYEAELRAKNVNAAIENLGPALENLLGDLGAAASDTWRKDAKDLLESIDQTQIEALKDQGAAELADDLVKTLRAIVDADDASEARAIMVHFAPKLREGQGTLGPILKREQAKLLLRLIRFAGAGA